MDDLDSIVRARLAMEEGAGAQGPEPIDVGPFAPYPVWLTVTLVVRGAQLVFAACCLWSLAALFHAMGRLHSVSLPPMWLWAVPLVLGASDGRSVRRWRTSPAGDAIGNLRFAAMPG